jgi:hypothetical protein
LPRGLAAGFLAAVFFAGAFFAAGFAADFAADFVADFAAGLVAAFAPALAADLPIDFVDVDFVAMYPSQEQAFFSPYHRKINGMYQIAESLSDELELSNDQFRLRQCK